MKRQASKASLATYVGIIMLLSGGYPFMDTELESSRAFEAGWHLWLFLGAVCLVYGVETLRRNARRNLRSLA